MRILIAEDDRASRRLLMVNLMNGGHEVFEAEDGQRAWDAWQQEHFRLVITDWMMPYITGLDLIRRIRSDPQTGYTYTIVVTALEDKQHVLEGLAAGADDYLSKPYYGEELLARVKIGERILQLEDRLHDAREQVEYQAMHDGLTGLLNRRAIQEHAEAEVKRALRASAKVSLLMLDLDFFKKINDQHGHSVGDQALRMFAEVLLENIRLYDWVGRWGGEEFLCVLPGAALNDAKTVAERIRAGVENIELPVHDVSPLRLTVSIGAASADGASNLILLDKLVRAADEALYQAKELGRNRVCLSE